MQSNAKNVLAAIKMANIQLVNVGSSDITEGKINMLLQVLQQLFKRIFSNEIKQFIKDNEQELKQLLNLQNIANLSIEQQLIQFYQNIQKEVKSGIVISRIQDLSNPYIYLYTLYRYDWVKLTQDYGVSYQNLQFKSWNDNDAKVILNELSKELVKYETGLVVDNTSVDILTRQQSQQTIQQNAQQTVLTPRSSMFGSTQGFGGSRSVTSMSGVNGATFNSWIMLSCKIMQFYLQSPQIDKKQLFDELQESIPKQNIKQKVDIESQEGYIESLYWYFNQFRHFPQFEFITLKNYQDKLKYVQNKEGLLPDQFPIQLIDELWVILTYFNHQVQEQYKDECFKEVGQFLKDKYQIEVDISNKQDMYNKILEAIVKLGISIGCDGNNDQNNDKPKDIQQIDIQNINQEQMKKIILEYCKQMNIKYPYEVGQMFKFSQQNVNFMITAIKQFKIPEKKAQISQDILISNFNFIMEWNKKDIQITQDNTLTLQVILTAFDIQSQEQLKNKIEQQKVKFDENKLTDINYLFEILQVIIQDIYNLDKIQQNQINIIKDQLGLNLNDINQIMQNKQQIFDNQILKQLKDLDYNNKYLQNDIKFYIIQQSIISQQTLDQIQSQYQLEDKQQQIQQLDIISTLINQIQQIQYLYKFVVNFYDIYQQIHEKEIIAKLDEQNMSIENYHNKIILLQQILQNLIPKQIILKKFEKYNSNYINFSNNLLSSPDKQIKCNSINDVIVETENKYQKFQQQIKQLFEPNEDNSIAQYLLLQLIYQENNQYEKYIIYTQEFINLMIQNTDKSGIQQSNQFIKQLIYYNNQFSLNNQTTQLLQNLYIEQDNEKDEEIQEYIQKSILCQQCYYIQQVIDIISIKCKINENKLNEEENILFNNIISIIQFQQKNDKEINNILTLYLQKNNFIYDNYDFTKRSQNGQITDEKLINYLLDKDQYLLQYSIFIAKLYTQQKSEENNQLFQEKNINQDQLINYIVTYLHLHQYMYRTYKFYIKFVKKDNFIKFSTQIKNLQALISIISNNNIYSTLESTEDILQQLQQSGIETRFIQDAISEEQLLILCQQLINKRVNSQETQQYFESQYKQFETQDLNEIVQILYQKSLKQMLKENNVDDKIFDDKMIKFLFISEKDKTNQLCLFTNSKLVVQIYSQFYNNVTQLDEFYKQLQSYWIKQLKLQESVQIVDLLQALNQNIYLEQNEINEHKLVATQVFSEQLLMLRIYKQYNKEAKYFIDLLNNNCEEKSEIPTDLQQFKEYLLSLSQGYQIDLQSTLSYVNQQSPQFTKQNLIMLFFISLLNSTKDEIIKQLKLNGLPTLFSEIQWNHIIQYYKKYKPDTQLKKPKSKLQPIQTQLILLKAKNWVQSQPILLSQEYLSQFLANELNDKDVQLSSASISKFFKDKQINKSELSKNIPQIYKSNFIKSPEYQLTCYIQQKVFKPMISTDVLYQWIEYFVGYQITDQFLQSIEQIKYFLEQYFFKENSKVEKALQIYKGIKQQYWQKQFFSELYNQSNLMFKKLQEQNYENIQCLQQIQYTDDKVLDQLNQNIQNILDNQQLQITQKDLNKLMRQYQITDNIEEYKNKNLSVLFIVTQYLYNNCPWQDYYNSHLCQNYYDILLEFNYPFEIVDEVTQSQAKAYLTEGDDLSQAVGMYKYVNLICDNIQDDYNEKVQFIKDQINQWQEQQQNKINPKDIEMDKLSEDEFKYFMKFLINICKQNGKYDDNKNQQQNINQLLQQYQSQQFLVKEIQEILEVRKYIVKLVLCKNKTNQDQSVQKLIELIRQQLQDVNEINCMEKLKQVGSPYFISDAEFANEDSLQYAILYMQQLNMNEQN